MLAEARLQTIVCCTSQERSENFYVEMLGLPIIQRRFNGVVLDIGGGDLLLCEVPDVQPSTHTLLGFAVDDVDGAVAGLSARGVTIERFAGFAHDPAGIAIAPDGTRVAWLRDPDGHILFVAQFPTTCASAERNHSTPDYPSSRAGSVARKEAASLVRRTIPLYNPQLTYLWWEDTSR